VHPNPLADAPPTDAEDVELARLAQSGSKDALESLVMRHPAFVAMSPESLTRRATSRSLLKLGGGPRPSTQLFLDRQS
jgi:hypothetical protein